MSNVRSLFAHRMIRSVALLGAGLVVGLLVAGPGAGAAVPVKASYSPLGALTSSGPTPKVIVRGDTNPPTAAVVVPLVVVPESANEVVLMGLPWDNGQINTLVVCYEKTSFDTYISQTQLTDMTSANSATIVFNSNIDRLVSGPLCYGENVNFTPSGTVTLHLKVVFASTSDRIKIGHIRLNGLTLI